MFYAVAMPLYGFLGMLRRYKSSLHFNWYKVQAETFAKFLFPNSRNLNKDFRLLGKRNFAKVSLRNSNSSLAQKTLPVWANVINSML